MFEKLTSVWKELPSSTLSFRSCGPAASGDCCHANFHPVARSTITFKPGKTPVCGSIYIECSTSRPVVMPDGAACPSVVMAVKTTERGRRSDVSAGSTRLATSSPRVRRVRRSVCSIALLLVCLEWKPNSYDHRTQLPSFPKLQHCPKNKNEARIRLTSPNVDDQTLYVKLRGTREAGF
jgi:hypothetical protein